MKRHTDGLSSRDIAKQPLIVGGRVSMIALWIGIACSVEALNVYVPPRGIASIQQEDLRRDIWSLEIASEAFDIWFHKRVKQLHLEPVSGNEQSCFRRQGEAETGIVFWTDSKRRYSNVSVSALLSLAKSTDQTHNPQSIVYCSVQPPVFFNDWKIIEIADVSGKDIVLEEGRWTSNSDEKYSFTDLQFEQIARNTKVIAETITPYLPSDFVPKR